MATEDVRATMMVRQFYEIKHTVQINVRQMKAYIGGGSEHCYFKLP